MARCRAVINFGSRIRFSSSSTVCRLPDSTASNHFSSSSSLSLRFRPDEDGVNWRRGVRLDMISSTSSGGALGGFSCCGPFCLPKEIFNLIGGLLRAGLEDTGEEISIGFRRVLFDDAFRALSLVAFGVSLTALGGAGSFFLPLLFFPDVWGCFRPDLVAGNFATGLPEHAGQKYGTSSLLTHSSSCVTPTHWKWNLEIEIGDDENFEAYKRIDDNAFMIK